SGKPYLEESAFEAQEKDFQEVIDLLKGDKPLEKFRVEYENLHAVMKKSHENERRLREKCRKLNAELVVNSCKLATLTKLSTDDKETISSLKAEFGKTRELLNTAYEKEWKARETIKSLQKDIAHLTDSVQKRSELSQGQEHNIQNLLNLKEELTKEQDQLLSEIVNLRQSLTQATQDKQDGERAKNEADQSVMQLQQEIQLQQNEVSRETRKKERMEKELKNLLTEMNNKQAEIKNLQQHIEKNKEEQLLMKLHIIEQKILNGKTGEELEEVQKRNDNLIQERKQHNVMLKEMMRAIQQETADLKVRRKEVAQIRLEMSKLNKIRHVLQNKMRVAEEQKVEAEHERTNLKNKISGLERELQAAEKQAEIDKKAIEELLRERDIISMNLVKATGATQKQINLVKLHERAKKKLEQEIQNYKKEAQKQRKFIYQLEKERDYFISETDDLKQKVLHNLKDREIQEMQISGYMKQIEESEIKLKQEQRRCEAMEAEKRLCSKNLIEAKDEIAELMKRLKYVINEKDQLNKKITDKEAALAKARLEHQQTEKEKYNLKAEIRKMKNQTLETKHFVENQKAEEQKLLKIIAEAEAERLKQKKEYDHVINERDVLGSQLVRRNDELALLYEKIKIQQSILNKGENQYRQKMEDIRLLKLEIKKLRREKGILGKSVANVKELREEVHHMQKELLREQTWCKLLEEELEKPLNVHRWRKLEACDPSTYELIEKVHRLQKQLISKTDEVIEKELLLQEKEKLYVELKHILARQPGPEVAEQLRLYQHTLREKTKQLKVLSSELNMYESQSREYKYEIERLANELLNVKNKYLAQKRKEQRAKEKERSLTDAEPEFPRHKSDVPRFTGGGFALSRPLPRVT
ncbi:Coiled-coil domain-containing protein 147, partial [Mesitornis unicolor]